MLREVASSRPQLLISVAILAAGIACGAIPACSGSPATIPLVTLPAVATAPAIDGAAATASVAIAASLSLPTSKAPTAIAWMTSERDARDRARRQNLPLLVYVHADWAAPCIELERGAWRDPRVLAEARGFVPLRLDVTSTDDNAELYAQRYGVRGVPEIIVVDPAGRILASSIGASSVDDLVRLLHSAASD